MAVLNKANYYGLVLGLLISSVSLPHGGLLSVVIVEAFLLFELVFSKMYDPGILALLIIALICHWVIILLGLKSLKSKRHFYAFGINNSA